MSWNLKDPIGRAEALEHEVAVKEIKRDADRIFKANERGPVEPPVVHRLDELLAQPDIAPRWRIRDVQQENFRIVLAAQFKAGKTTLMGNLVRSLVDGELFLGKYEVVPFEGTVGVLDFEMTENQLVVWYRDLGVTNTDRVWLAPLRGKAGSFDIFDKEVRARWVKLLTERNVRYLIVDCLRPILDALGLNENYEATKFLNMLGSLLDEAAIGECIIVQHMGHQNERSRGDSALRAWPDVEWMLVRQEETPEAKRFFKAFGRDVLVPEQELAYDPATRRLTAVGGSRADAKVSGMLAEVLAYIENAKEPPNMTDIINGLHSAGRSSRALRAALTFGIKSGQIVTEPGPKNSTLHRLGKPARPTTTRYGEQTGADTKMSGWEM